MKYFDKYKKILDSLKEERSEKFENQTDGENYIVDEFIRTMAQVCRDFRNLEKF